MKDLSLFGWTIPLKAEDVALGKPWLMVFKMPKTENGSQNNDSLSPNGILPCHLEQNANLIPKFTRRFMSHEWCARHLWASADMFIIYMENHMLVCFRVLKLPKSNSSSKKRKLRHVALNLYEILHWIFILGWTIALTNLPSWIRRGFTFILFFSGWKVYCK